MELAPHDLLIIDGIHNIISEVSMESWVYEAIEEAPFVVVRRQPIIEGMIPVGIRGKNRSQRFAAFIYSTSIKERITPEELAINKTWEITPRLDSIDILSKLPVVNEILNSLRLKWGPVGSIGFELASRIPMVNHTSDLDIILRTPEILPFNIAKHIIHELSKLNLKFDIQIETFSGAVALEEYARGDSPILLKTINGPKLLNIL